MPFNPRRANGRIVSMRVRTGLRQFFTSGAPETGYNSGWDSSAARRMFWLGLAVRLLYITLAHTYRFRDTEDHFPFGWEMGRIARALATGRGFSDPFGGHTGPTAWTPPLYPLLMGATFRLFGVYSAAAGWVLLAVNSLFSAATAPFVFEIADRCYGPRPDGYGVALWSGWLWALYPAAMQYAVHWPWDMALTACFFSATLALGLRLRGTGSTAEVLRPVSWGAFGFSWGLVALSNSSLLLFLPFQILWILWPFRTHLLAVVMPSLSAVLVFCTCVTPWVIRNQHVFHAFVPLRGNFGAELYMSALPSHEGFPWGTDIPISGGSHELRRYAELGEVAYSRMQGKRARAMIAADRGRFAREILLRFQFYWAGVPHPYDHGVLNEFVRQLNYSFLSVAGLLGLALSLHRRVPAAGLFAAAFVVLPLIYYLVTVQARFRHPLEPLITILAVYLFRSADPTRLFSVFGSPHEPTQVAA